MAEIFNITMESDLSQWTSETDTEDDLSQDAAAGLAGSSGGMLLVYDNTTAMYCEKTFSEITPGTGYTTRVYIDPNSITMASGNSFVFLRVQDGSSNCLLMYLRYDGSNYNVYVTAYDDGASTHDTSSYVITDAEHYVEVQVTFSTDADSEDATVELKIDGASQETLSGLDIYAKNPDKAQLGAISGLDVGTTGTFYLDEFVLRDDLTWPGALVTESSSPSPSPSPSLSPSSSESPSASSSSSSSESPSVSPSSSASASIGPGLYFEIRHEDDLTEYTSLVDEGDLSRQVAAALNSSVAGLQVIYDDTDPSYGERTFGPLGYDTHTWRVFFDPNSLAMGTGDTFTFARTLSGGANLCLVGLTWTGTAYQVRVRVFDDNNDAHDSAWTTVTDAEHFVEVQVQYASGAAALDGVVRFRVDGGTAEAITGLDLYANQPDTIQLGAVAALDGTTSGIFYIDEFALYADDTWPSEVSESPSPSASPSAAPGSICWGHVTGVTEDRTHTFDGNWTGTGTIYGSDDDEAIGLATDEYMDSEIVETGAEYIEITHNVYQAGDTVTVYYRTAATSGGVSGESWTEYTSQFVSSGYVQVRVYGATPT